MNINICQYTRCNYGYSTVIDPQNIVFYNVEFPTSSTGRQLSNSSINFEKLDSLRRHLQLITGTSEIHSTNPADFRVLPVSPGDPDQALLKRISGLDKISYPLV